LWDRVSGRKEEWEREKWVRENAKKSVIAREMIK